MISQTVLHNAARRAERLFEIVSIDIAHIKSAKTSAKLSRPGRGRLAGRAGRSGDAAPAAVAREQEMRAP